MKKYLITILLSISSLSNVNAQHEARAFQFEYENQHSAYDAKSLEVYCYTLPVYSQEEGVLKELEVMVSVPEVIKAISSPFDIVWSSIVTRYIDLFYILNLMGGGYDALDSTIYPGIIAAKNKIREESSIDTTLVADEASDYLSGNKRLAEKKMTYGEILDLVHDQDFTKKFKQSGYLEMAKRSLLTTHSADGVSPSQEVYGRLKAKVPESVKVVTGNGAEVDGKITIKYKYAIASLSERAIVNRIARILDLMDKGFTGKKETVFLNFNLALSMNADAESFVGKYLTSSNWIYPGLLDRNNNKKDKISVQCESADMAANLEEATLKLLGQIEPLDIYDYGFLGSFSHPRFEFAYCLNYVSSLDVTGAFAHRSAMAIIQEFELFPWPFLSLNIGWEINSFETLSGDFFFGAESFESHSFYFGPRLYYPVTKGFRLHGSLGYQTYTMLENLSDSGDDDFFSFDDDYYSNSGIYYEVGASLFAKRFPLWYLSLAYKKFSESSNSFANDTKILETSLFRIGLGFRFGVH